MMGFDGYGMMSGYGWVWASLITLLVLGGLITLVVWVIRTFSRDRSTGDNSLEVLRRRLAAGEISQEEYERTRRVL
jgi:putative membrane protein